MRSSTPLPKNSPNTKDKRTTRTSSISTPTTNGKSGGGRRQTRIRREIAPVVEPPRDNQPTHCDSKNMDHATTANRPQRIPLVAVGPWTPSGQDARYLSMPQVPIPAGNKFVRELCWLSIDEIPPSSSSEAHVAPSGEPSDCKGKASSPQLIHYILSGHELQLDGGASGIDGSLSGRL